MHISRQTHQLPLNESEHNSYGIWNNESIIEAVLASCRILKRTQSVYDSIET